MKGKVESRQCCILCEGATMQKMLFSDNVKPVGEGSWPGSKKDLGIQMPPVAMSLYDYRELMNITNEIKQDDTASRKDLYHPVVSV